MNDESLPDPAPEPLPEPAVRERRRERRRLVRKRVAYTVRVFPEARSLWQRIGRCLAVLAALVLISVPFLYWKRAALRDLGNEWSADRHLSRARAELEEGRPEVAVRRALSALQLDPGRIESHRVLLEGARGAGDSRLLLMSLSLLQHPEATPEDQVQSLAAINDTGDLRRFEAFFGALPEATRALPSARYEALRHRLLKGEAREVARTVAEGGAPHDGRDFLVLSLDALASLADPGSRERWFALALELIEDAATEAERDEIWTRLASSLPSRFSAEEAERLSELAERLPPGDGVDRSLAFTLRIAADPSRRDETLHEAVASLLGDGQGEIGDLDDLDDLCLWLTRLGETGLLLESIDERQAFRSDVAFRARARALVAEGRFEEAHALLQFPPRTAERMAALVMQAEVERALGRRRATLWQEALAEAEREMRENRYLELARFALSSGELEVAATALVAACRHPLGIMPPSEEMAWLTRYLIEKDEPIDLLAVIRRLMQNESDHPELLNNAIYLSLILDGEWFESGDQHLEKAAALVERYPAVDGIRSTLALARLMSGQAEAALEAFPSRQLQGEGWRSLGEADRAVLAMAFLESGDETQARLVASSVRWEDLLRIERRFFRHRLRHLVGEGGEEVGR